MNINLSRLRIKMSIGIISHFYNDSDEEIIINIEKLSAVLQSRKGNTRTEQGEEVISASKSWGNLRFDRIENIKSSNYSFGSAKISSWNDTNYHYDSRWRLWISRLSDGQYGVYLIEHKIEFQEYTWQSIQKSYRITRTDLVDLIDELLRRRG